MNFILRHDLLTKIKEQELTILLEDSTTTPDAELLASIGAAELELKSYIEHRYDKALSMPPLWYYDPIAERQVDEVIFVYIKDEFDIDKTYELGDLVFLSNGRVYRSLTNSNTGNIPTADFSNWEQVALNFHFYKSLIADNNDAPITGASWVDLGTTDPRHQLLKRMHIDLTLYDLHARIKPRQIPEHRIQLRDDAIQFLRDSADPRKNITLDLPLVDHGERSGVDMTFGGNKKITHSY